MGNPALVEAFSRLDGDASDILRLEKALEQAPLGLPGAALLQECREARHRIAALKARCGRKLVVTLIGPSGSGKSTLLNAMAGIDGLSESGITRPTTTKIHLVSRDTVEMEDILQALERADVALLPVPSAAFLDQLILVDTPDTDSMYLEQHREMLQSLLPVSDVLLCLFDAENPKRKDHTEYLAPYIQRFHGESLLVVLNKCDRLDGETLEAEVIPEFMEYLQNAWEKPIAGFFAVSARSNLRNPGWDPTAPPRNTLDQFDALQAKLRNELNQEGYAMDRRLKNVRTLRDRLLDRAKSAACRDGEFLSMAQKRLSEIEAAAADRALEAIRLAEARFLSSISGRIYRELMPRWIGPVGWLIAGWQRLTAFGAGVAAVWRFRRPVREIRERWVHSHRNTPDENRAHSAEEGPTGLALWEYRLAIVKGWGEVASLLVSGGFDPSVRAIDTALEGKEVLVASLSLHWKKTVADEIRRSVEKLSSAWLQLVNQCPTVVGMAGW